MRTHSVVVVVSGGRDYDASQHSSGTGGIKTIVVLSGKHADALLEWNTTRDNGQTQCGEVSSSFKVTPPNTYATHTFHYPIGRCELAIHPVYDPPAGQAG